MERHYARAEEILVQIEQCLQALDMWEQRSPAPELLASTQPFCYDTLELQQWLQWIFIPTIQSMIADRNPLPAQCDIASYAEVFYEKGGIDAGQLIAAIREFDQFIQGEN